MSENNRIQEIKERIKQNAYFINPHSDVNVKSDLEYLVGLVEQLEKKNKLLATQVAELIQEMENVKSDFGGDPR